MILPVVFELVEVLPNHPDNRANLFCVIDRAFPSFRNLYKDGLW